MITCLGPGFPFSTAYTSRPTPPSTSTAPFLSFLLPRRQEEVWRASALSKLPALQAASDMLVCGEDLGFVPACVPPVMKVSGWVSGWEGGGKHECSICAGKP